MEKISPAAHAGEVLAANGILPGEIKHEISMVATGHVIYACQLSPSMAIFTLESRFDQENHSDVETSTNSIYPWNHGDNAGDGGTHGHDRDENLRYLDVILKRNDSWGPDLIGTIHNLLEKTLAEEQEDMYSQKLKPRMVIRVEGFPERMLPKFDGDVTPICLHAQSIHVGDIPAFQATGRTEQVDNQKTPTRNLNTSCTPKQEEPSATTSESNNKKGKHGGVGDNTRFSKFVHFLVSEFGGYETLLQKPVLDIAGGAGGLAFELCMRHEIEAIVVDTKEVKLKAQQVRHLNFRKHCLEQLAKDPHATAHKSLLKENLQNRFRMRDFVQLNTLLDSSSILPSQDTSMVFHGRTPSSEAEQQLHSILNNRECSVMVGIHPDQALDPIVDIGLALGIPWAVVPCCVFPNLFTQRKLASGRPVRNYEDLCEYIQQRDPNIQRTELPFRGRNLVLYWHPPPA